MIKKIILLVLFLLVPAIIISANTLSYPDYSRLIEKTNQNLHQQADYYEQFREILIDSKEMENYDVTYYKIDIDIDIDEEFIESEITMRARICEDQTSQIQMNFTNNLTINNITQNSIPLSYTHAEDIITIQLYETYNTDDMIELVVSYDGNPDSKLSDGMKFESHSGTPNVFTMCSPKGARKWWACKDTPADKPDSLDLWITYPDEYVCASNGLLVDQIDNGNGTVTDKWHESYPVTTYLTSLAISNYQIYSQSYTSSNGTMPIDHYLFPELYSTCEDLFSITPTMITFYASIYGEYPFLEEKYGHALCANLSCLAMEHQTCTSFRSAYVGDPDAESTVAHELSHQWAGDCLSIGSWEHVWLKEGFARYSEALWAEYLYGSQGLHDYMNALDTGTDLDACLRRDPDGTASQIFDIVIYSKGGWTMHMLRGVLGDTDFFATVYNLMQDPQFKYGNLLTDDLRDIAENTSGMELDWFFHEWFYNEGRPYYFYTTYTSDSEDSLIIATQSEGTFGQNFAMQLPVCVNETDYSIFADSGFCYNKLPLTGTLNDLIFDPDNWVLDGGYNEKIPILDEIEATRGAILLVWDEFFDQQIEGFNIYRKQIAGEYIKINDEPISGLFYFDENVVAGVEYYYKIAAVLDNNRNYISKFSNEVHGTSIDFSLDQGILVIDETDQINPAFPSNAEVDSFYCYLLQGYEFTEWDVDDQGDLPPLSEMAKYSSIVWHSDEMFTSQFIGSVYPLKSYFIAGGNMFISGWKHLPGPSELFVDYLHTTLPTYNSDDDFAGAFGMNGLPYLDVVEGKVPIITWGDNLSYIYKLFPLEDADTLYTYDSSIDAPEWENKPCALRYDSDYKLYLLGFPLYYMDEEGAKQLMHQAMQDFGEVYSVDQNHYDEFSINVFPNPVRNVCEISYYLDKKSHINIEAYNIKGQLVKKIKDEMQSPGEYNFDWNTEKLANGVYLLKMVIEKTISNHKILILN
ncbi:MAG: T9SS type A sorting domain-containing protein [Candidatus Cloacimonetes bacterium]|nr:T9SS type A sorting domain-containing protein [Candidatus Cloacimonadota bacterium]